MIPEVPFEATFLRPGQARHRAIIRALMAAHAPRVPYLPGDIEINAGRPTTLLRVFHTGIRPIQVGSSHYHFSKTNPALAFDRAKARAIPRHSGRHAAGCEPGQSREIPPRLLRLGALLAQCFPREIAGPLSYAKMTRVTIAAAPIPRFRAHPGDRSSARRYPIFIAVERGSHGLGEEGWWLVGLGGRQVIRDGMGQSSAPRAAGRSIPDYMRDLDHWGS